MPSTMFKLSGTSFNQPIIKKLKLRQDVRLETEQLSESDSEIEDLSGGGTSNPAIKCFTSDDELIGYVPPDIKKRVRELIKEGKSFKVHKLNTFKDNPTIGVRIITK